MKKKLLAFLLAAALAAGCCLPGFAAKGPADAEKDGGSYYGELCLYGTENGFQITDNEGYPVKKYIYKENVSTPQPGAVYDRAANTLYLTDFNGRNFDLYVEAMGDDFTMNVKGNCFFNSVSLRGMFHGCSLRITGDGSLTINGEGLAAEGLWCYTDRTDLTVDVADSVKCTIGGYVNPIAVYARLAIDYATNKEKEPNKVRFLSGGKEVKLTAERCRVPDMPERRYGYSGSYDYPIFRGSLVGDPDGVYSIYKDSEYHGEDDSLEFFVSVQRFLYEPELDLYFPDYGWAAAHGAKEGVFTARFADTEAVKAAGFSLPSGGEDDPTPENVSVASDLREQDVFADAAGKKYVCMYGASGFCAADIVPLKAVPGRYYFRENPAVDPNSLTQVTTDYTAEKTYDYFFTGETWTNGAVPGDVDGSGAIEVTDARLCLRRAINLESYPVGGREYTACNVDGDSSVSVADARLILRVAIKIDDPHSFPVYGK